MEHRLAAACLNYLKSEFEVYYTAFFSRKACPFLCIGLCGVLIAAYFYGNITEFFSG